MKPENWKDLDGNQASEIAASLLKSMRGSLIVGQALYIASQVLKKMDHPFNEVSNAEDMEMIGECLFPIGFCKETMMDIPEIKESFPDRKSIIDTLFKGKES